MSRPAGRAQLLLAVLTLAAVAPRHARAQEPPKPMAPAAVAKGADKPIPGLPRVEEAAAGAAQAQALAVFPTVQHYSVYGNEFDPGHAAIQWASQGGLTNRFVSKCGIAVCHLAAPLHLPQGAQVKGVTCKVVDNSPTHPVAMVVAWAPGDGFSYSRSDCGAKTSQAGASSAIVSLSASCPIVIDNSKYAYFVEFHTYGGPGTSATLCESGGAACRVYDCFVAYQ